MKRIFLIVLAVMMLCVSVIFPVSAEGRESTLMQELESATVNGKAFNFADYPKKAGANAELLSFMEIGYSYTGDQRKYGLYVYIYNPSEKVIVESGKNKITLATKYDAAGMSKASDYEQFDLQYVDKTSNNRFYKFLVIDHVSAHDGNKIVQRVDKDARKYMMSEFEVQYVGDSKATSSGISKQFVFVGYQSDKTLTCTMDKIDVIQPKVTYTYFRTETSEEGLGHRNQLNSVYFTVPNSLLKAKGTLSRIKLTWNEQKLSPVFVTTDDKVYGELLKYVGISAESYNPDHADSRIPVRMYSYPFEEWSVLLKKYRHYKYTYNMDLTQSSTEDYRSDYVIDALGYIFKKDKFESGAIGVPRDTLLAWIEKYEFADWLFSDTVDENRKKGTQTVEVKLEDTYNLLSYAENLDKWQKVVFKALGRTVEDSYKNLSPFYYLKAEDISSSKKDSEIAKSLCVGEDAVSKLRDLYTAATLHDETVVIFRYAVTDYNTQAMKYHSYTYSDGAYDADLYCAQETVFFDWDMIELEFMLNGVPTVIPVAMSPQHHVGDITDPLNPSSGLDLSWLKAIVQVLAVVIVVAVLMGFLPMAMDAVGGLFGNAVEDARTSIRRMKKNKGGKQ